MADPITPSAAANIYKTAQSIAATSKDASSEAKETGLQGPGFGDLVKKAAVNSIDTLRAGEKVSADAVIGNADLTDVVEAVTKAELTLQTAVSIRDRMMSAYQEIMRMPI